MVSSSLSLSAGSLFLALLASSAAAASESYQLVENWHGESFLDYFNFHTGTDPTNGFVTYLDKSSAESAGLVKVNDGGSVYIGVDHTTTLSPSGKGRDSVRIGSKKYYDQSLVIADIAHMPGSICGSWPAFWSVGQNWPSDGEIDIIEGVNLQDHNEIVMHTAGTCSITDTGMTGAVNATGCGEDLGTVGCVIEGDQGSYGTLFNKQGGGVYAMQWTEQFLKIWFFPRSSIPASITKGVPDVSQFGTPMALVEEGCDVANSFKAQSFIFDVTFCGDWAGGVFGQSGCPMSSSDSSQSCINYVAKNPTVFEQTYWEINSVKIYQTGVESRTVASTSHSATHTPATQAVTVASATQATQATQASAVVAETPASQGWNTVSAASAATEASNTAGSVGELGDGGSSATAQTTKSSTTRYVTKFVTSTTTLCPVAEASASSAAVAESQSSVPSLNAANIPATAQTVYPEPSATTKSIKDIQTLPVAQVPAVSSPAAVPTSEIVNSQASSQPAGAEAASSSVLQSASVCDRPLPTIIPAPGINLGSGMPTPNASQTKPVSPIATGSSAASGSVFQGSTSTAASPVFTGAADKASVKFPAIIAAFALAMLA
ncbi:endo-1-3(4)-beta-glucanase [Penicillium canariense]|uniref:endo-1,3(4)-beta-glucanase n=1 Tax=Penicillium canariense TaxID=189055 RepID=A0A9W9LKA7_9EURO|nr:endo-1-3(4)-beta-glucanase [Penicillium canariense]KAJ5160925.1 endo-1-3(4)-beta-glucanase [Penicillium canariense]